MPLNRSAPEHYEATFSRSLTVVLILLIIPIVFAIGIILPLALWPQMPDWLPALLALPTVAVSLGLVHILYTRYAAIPATVELDEAGIRISLQRPSPFYQEAYSASWEAISKVSSNVETRHNKRYYRITFRDSGKTVQLMPDEYADEYCEAALGEALLNYADRYNETYAMLPERLIRRKGFCEA